MDLLRRALAWPGALLVSLAGLTACGEGTAGGDGMEGAPEREASPPPMAWVEPVLPDERVVARRRGSGDAHLAVPDPGDEYIVYAACDATAPIAVRERAGRFEAEVACDRVVQRTQVFSDSGGSLDVVVEAPSSVPWTLLLTRRPRGS